MRLRDQQQWMFLLLAATAAACTYDVRAQPERELTLGETLHLAVRGNFAIRESGVARDGAEADVMIADGAFGWIIQAGLAGEHVGRPPAMGAPTTSFPRLSTAYEFSFGRMLPMGVRADPIVRVSNLHGSRWSAENMSTQVGLALHVPLTQVGGSNPALVQVRSSQRRARATGYLYLHALSEQLAQVAAGYWDAVEASTRVEILKAAEARAQEILSMIERLVSAGERPSADLKRIEAYVADRVSARTSSEHQRFVALERLAVLLGSNGGRVAGREVRLQFPVMPGKAHEPRDESFVSPSAESRWDVLAAREEVASSEEQLRGVRVAARRQVGLDLTSFYGTAGSLALARGSTSVSLSLVLRQPIPNRVGAGLIAQRQFVLTHHAIRLEALQRGALAAARIARDALDTAVREVHSADVARAAHVLTVEQELLRLANGFATILDVTVAEERLTNAELVALAASARYARALVRDAHEHGRIVQSEDESAEAWSARIQTKWRP